MLRQLIWPRPLECLVQHLTADRLGHEIDCAVLSHFDDGLHLLGATDGDNNRGWPTLANFTRKPHPIEQGIMTSENTIWAGAAAISVRAALAPFTVTTSCPH